VIIYSLFRCALLGVIVIRVAIVMSFLDHLCFI
jgi:hypothetical protein